MATRFDLVKITDAYERVLTHAAGRLVAEE